MCRSIQAHKLLTKQTLVTRYMSEVFRQMFCLVPMKTATPTASFSPHAGTTGRATHLRPDRVFDANDSDAGEVIQYVVLSIPVWLSCLRWEVPVRDADCPQSVTSHRLNHLAYHLIAIFWLKSTRLTLDVQDAGTPGGGDGEKKRESF